MGIGIDTATAAREFRLDLELSGKNVCGDIPGPRLILNPGLRQRRREERKVEEDNTFKRKVEVETKAREIVARREAARNAPNAYKGTMKEQSAEEKEKVRQIQERARQEKLKRRADAVEQEAQSNPKRARTTTGDMSAAQPAATKPSASRSDPLGRYREKLLHLEPTTDNPWRDLKGHVLQPYKKARPRTWAPPSPPPSTSSPPSSSSSSPASSSSSSAQPQPQPQPRPRQPTPPPPPQPQPTLKHKPPPPSAGDPLFMNAAKRCRTSQQGTIHIAPVPGSTTGNRTVRTSALPARAPATAPAASPESERVEQEKGEKPGGAGPSPPPKKKVKVSLAEYLKMKKGENGGQ